MTTDRKSGSQREGFNWRDDERFRQVVVKIGCTEDYNVARAELARMIAEQEAKQ